MKIFLWIAGLWLLGAVIFRMQSVFRDATLGDTLLWPFAWWEATRPAVESDQTRPARR
jgi:uncharacterized RDD family membrane protein YckC